jgi:hypothetical protein
MQYADMLRAQLTNHEQALFYLNSLADVGAPWKRQHLIEDFQLIKNIPRGFFDAARETDPAVVYPKIKFEYMRTDTEFEQPNVE